MAWLGFIIVVAFMIAYGEYWHRRGYRKGLHAPLPTRIAALRADVRRAENGMGAAMPRVRRARFNRSPAKDESR